MARKAVQNILPLPLDTLKALTWDMVCLQSRARRSNWCGSLSRRATGTFSCGNHSCVANQYSSWVQMLGPVRGRPLELKLPIQKVTVRWLLAWRPKSLGIASCAPAHRTGDAGMYAG